MCTINITDRIFYASFFTIQKIADALNTTTEYLLGSSGTYVVEAHEKGGAKAAKDIEELVSEVTGMFAGGELIPELNWLLFFFLSTFL